MPERKTIIRETQTLIETAGTPITLGITPTSAERWTLDDAFLILRQAVALYYQEENIPAYMACMETQMMFDNGNKNVAWAHLIQLLEKALGVPLRMS